ncbi:FAD-linked oxidoreductase azaL [Madurella fahalii]|uniref:FAD-linked oxidoreductase azaL n=1 Tax=Madurella fahalii TaxID=1157608 RepID=A0ABQ0G4P7_9PEZI
MAGLWPLLAGFAYLHLARAVSDPQAIAGDLRALLSPQSQIVMTSDASYHTDFVQRFSISRPPSFDVAVKPVSAADVSQVVWYALRNNVSLLATGGGHGYTWTLNRLRGGIDIDLGNFDSIAIDAAANTMTIGGSARSDDVTRALYAAGKELPVGMCTCVGFAGVTLGGGIGPYSGLYGATSDSLLSAEMVTGTGELLTVSETEHPDLFYGLKGAGFNYGVVTSLTYRVYPATNGGQTVVTNMIFPGHLNGTVWEVLSTVFGNQPRELGLALSVGYQEARGGMVIIVGFVYAGPETESTEMLRPFLDLKPQNLQILTVAWEDVADVIVYGATKAGCQRGAQFVPYSVNLYTVDVPNLIDVVGHMEATLAAEPRLRSLIVTWAQYAPYGFQQHADDSSAFPYRNPTVFIQINAFSPSADHVPGLNDFARELRDRFQRGSGSSSLETYVHFGHGDEPAVSWYSERKLPALRLLKHIYDPASLFSWYNAVPVEYP